MPLTNTKMGSRQRSLGFTLVEMLVIAPVIILVIGGIIALMVTLVGDVLHTREQTAMTYNLQSTLDQVEEDVRLATSIRSTSGPTVSGHGSNLNPTVTNSTDAFVSSNAIILTHYATTLNPADPNRAPVYLANSPNFCTVPHHVYNQTLTYQVVYYRNGSSLYRRTLVPTDPVCPGGLWQKNSCHRDACTYRDAKVLDDIETFSVAYFNGSSTTANTSADSDNTTSLRLSVTTKKPIAGKDAVASGAMRVSKINN